MKVLVFTPHTRWRPQYETELEIIQRHLDDGDEVTQLHCDGALLICDDNRYHNLLRCKECMGIRKAGMALLSSRVECHPFLTLTRANRRELDSIQKSFSTIDDLKRLKVDNFDIGWAVLSSVISMTRDPAPDMVALASMVRKYLESSLSVYRSLQNHLDSHSVDRVYVFNGRFAPCRAVLRACQSRKVKCFIHERGCDIHHYELWENTTPHDLAHTDREIRKYWDANANNPERGAIAERFYTARALGASRSWHSYVKDQEIGLLPGNWNPAKKNLVIFNSSEDELASIGDEWRNPLYRNQLEGISRMVDSLKAYGESIHLYLRIHPNLKYVQNDDLKALLQMHGDHLSVIPPDDPVSTYALIKHADKVISFGSTVGIEAVYWGTPSILAGVTFYQNLGGTYIPGSHDELMEMINADLPAKDKTPALMYGFYLETFGTPYKYYRAMGLDEGTFKGHRVEVQPSRWMRFCHMARDRFEYLQGLLFVTSTRRRVLGWKGIWPGDR